MRQKQNPTSKPKPKRQSRTPPRRPREGAIQLKLSARQVREVRTAARDLDLLKGRRIEYDNTLVDANTEIGLNEAATKYELSASLLRGFAILDALMPPGTVKGFKQISDELGMAPSTTYRYLQTLLRIGLVEHQPRKRYRLAATLEAEKPRRKNG